IENFSGRLPIVFPRSEDDTAPFDNTSDEVFYDYLHGYRLIDDLGRDPLFPFVFGLSYTAFALDNAGVSEQDGVVTVTADVTNSGTRTGVARVPVYVGYPASSVERAPVDLRAFVRVDLDPGATETAHLTFPTRDLAYFDEISGEWVVEDIDYTVYIGRDAQ